MAFVKELVPDFNKEWAKKVTKEEFVEQHAHLGSVEFLESAYDKIVLPAKAIAAAEDIKEEPLIIPEAEQTPIKLGKKKVTG